jgi:hypothetical protein
MKNNLSVEAFPHQLPTKHINCAQVKHTKRERGGRGQRECSKQKVLRTKWEFKVNNQSSNQSIVSFYHQRISALVCVGDNKYETTM